MLDYGNKDETLRLLSQAVESTSDSILITDPRQPDNPIIYVNPGFTRTTGYSSAEAVGRNCRFLQRGDTEQADIPRLRECIRNAQECVVVLRNYRKDGTLFYNQLRVSPVFDEQKCLTNFVGVQTDVTTQHMEHMSDRHSVFLNVTDDFISALAHDLQAQLIGARHVLDFLLRGALGPLTPEQIEVLEELKHSNEEQSRYVRNLVDVYRFVVDGNSPAVPTDMTDLVRAVIDNLQETAARMGVNMQFEACDDHMQIEIDGQALQRAIDSLVRRSLADAQSRVTARLRSTPKRLLIDIEYDGDSQDTKAQTELERLVQRRNEHCTASGALAYYLCTKIIEGNGGEILTTAVANGNRLTLSLPR
jgi:PAS domain S-box-containing protein